MGQCAGCQKQSKKTLEAYWMEPLDTPSLKNNNLPTLHFQGILSNLKIKNCPYNYLTVKVEIEGVESFVLKQKKTNYDETIFWAFEQKFGLHLTEYQMRKRFIKIILSDEKDNIVGELQVNLYLISTGPYHQDFAINLKKKCKARVSFDFKISQILEVQLKSLMTEIDLIKKHPGQKFSYSIKTIIGNTNKVNISQPSFTVRVMLEDQEKIEIEESVRSEKNIHSKKSIKLPQKQIPANSNMLWNFEDGRSMPSIVIKTLACELHHAYFQILVWKVLDVGNQDEDLELYCQCYIALHKLFSIDPIISQQNNVSLETREIMWTEKLWHHGKQIGLGQFKFSVKNDKYIKQMQVMVRTQKGIMVYSPVYLDHKKSEGSQCKQLIQLAKTLTSVENNVIALDNMEANGINARKTKIQIEDQLIALQFLLKKTSKQSIICYSYSSESQLIEAQQLFMKLGFEVMSLLEEEDQLINQQCWKILILLLKRGQFNLAHLKIQGSSSKVKIQVALMYEQYLYKQLSLALKSLNVKGLQYQRTFAQIFCAYAYFKIPDFRMNFLSTIEQQNDPEIEEWRGIEFNLNEDVNFEVLRQDINTFTLLFDWQHSFYKCIEDEAKATRNKTELEQILKTLEWKHRFAKRGAAFHYFIIFWVEYIESIVVKVRDVQWRYFPGYNKIIKAFFVEMKSKSILEYPDSLKLACFKLLINQKLLNSIVMILLSKTNLYDPVTVFKTIEFIHELMTSLKKNKKKVPPTFNYLSFYKCCVSILDTDNSFAVSKILLLLFTHFQIFNNEFQKKISKVLTGRLFFKLFLNWSFNVREIFCNFLVYRMRKQQPSVDHHHSHRDILEHQQFGDYISFRIQKGIDVINQAIQQNKSEQIQKLSHYYEKDLYKVMKKKLRKRKLRQRKDNSNDIQKLPKFNKNSLSSYSKFKDENQRESDSPCKVQRSHSEVLTHKLQITHLNNQLKHEEVSRVGSNNYQFKHQIYDTSKGSRKTMQKSFYKSMERSQQQSDFILGNLNKNQSEYLGTAMSKLKQVQQLCRKRPDTIPQIKISMPVDGKQIRPESIDDW